MSYVNLGEKWGEPCSPSNEVAKDKPKVHYPSFHTKLDEIPDLKIGEVVEVKAKVRLVGVSKNDYDKGKTSCQFEIEAMDFGMKPKEKTKGEKLSDVVEEDLKEMDRD